VWKKRGSELDESWMKGGEFLLAARWAGRVQRASKRLDGDGVKALCDEKLQRIIHKPMLGHP
jgi:hypothetical protein